MEVTLLNEDITLEVMLQTLMADADFAIPFDCADPRVQFVVRGWFVCPKGSLTKPHDVKQPT